MSTFVSNHLSVTILFLTFCHFNSDGNGNGDKNKAKAMKVVLHVTNVATGGFIAQTLAKIFIDPLSYR
jgi:hypothetical protein